MANAARPAPVSFVERLPAADEVAAAACAELLDLDDTVPVLAVTPAAGVMGPVTATLVNVDMPPDERGAEPSAEVDSIGEMDVGDTNEAIAISTTATTSLGKNVRTHQSAGE